MSSPRKFSEKIALHNKKQAEETAAFEAVLREVSLTTRAALEKQQKPPQQTQQHLTQPNVPVYRGGSLPNVSQMSNDNSIDLQSALHCLEDMKQGCGRQSLIDKFHRDRNRQIHSVQNQRRQFPLEKRADCSPYGLTYLSPPPDTSWRRTNSDSAIHSSTMGGPPHSPQQHTSPPSPTSPVNRHGDALKGGDMWSLENLSHCPTRSHDVPGIGNYPTSLNDSGIHLPNSTNAESLPDLSSLPFASSLSGILHDGSDRTYRSSSHGNSMAISGQHAGHIGPVRTSQQNSPGTRHRQSHAGPSPLVLYGSSPSHSGVHNILPQDSSLDANMTRVDLNSFPSDRLNFNNAYHRSTSQDSGNYHDSGAVHISPPKITISEVTENGLVEHSWFDGSEDSRMIVQNDANRNGLQSGGSFSRGEQCASLQRESKRVYDMHDDRPRYDVPSGTQLNCVNREYADQSHMHGYQSCSYSHLSQRDDALFQYRNSSDCPQSPTSPLSQHSYSPSESPGLPNCTLRNSPFTDIYTLQQQQQNLAQANVLQQQFEQFTMLQDSPLPVGANSSSLYGLLMQQPQSPHQSVGMGLNFCSLSSSPSSSSSVPVKSEALDFDAQQQMNPDVYYQKVSKMGAGVNPYSAVMHDLPVSFGRHLPTMQARPHMTGSRSSNQAKAGGKIPDIILTGVDDGLGHEDHFGKGMLPGLAEPFDTELFSIDEALKVGLNPLELEELQMLTNPNVIADPATEDSFRLDQL